VFEDPPGGSCLPSPPLPLDGWVFFGGWSAVLEYDGFGGFTGTVPVHPGDPSIGIW